MHGIPLNDCTSLKSYKLGKKKAWFTTSLSFVLGLLETASKFSFHMTKQWLMFL